MNYRDIEYFKAELVWLYNYADSDCGIKSNWNAMVQAACSPGSSYSDPYNSFIMRAVDKRRDIEKALWSLPVQFQNSLCSVYGSNHLPHPITAVLGELGGPAICSQLLPLEPLEKLCNRKLLGKATPKDLLAISEIRMAAEELKNKSFNDYRRKRNEKKEK